mmetsp:Transcript_67290/g.197545  ORF Transcript_67290/g.197545 Transcript_67290/m.197545 type:complete len:237 (+) Transcript_67290:52-762(+)
MCAGTAEAQASRGKSEQVQVSVVGGARRLLELRHRCGGQVCATVDYPHGLVAHLRLAVVGHELGGVLEVVPVALDEVRVEARADAVQGCLRRLPSDVGVLHARELVEADVREPALELVGLREGRDQAHDQRDRAQGAQHGHGALAHLGACGAGHGELLRRPAALAGVSDHLAVGVHVEEVGGRALRRHRDGAVVGELALGGPDLPRETHLALKVLLSAGAVLADHGALELLAVEAL